MRRGIVLFCAALTACAHFDVGKLESWATGKAQQVAVCAAQSLATVADLDRCMGDVFSPDLGTEACGEADALRKAVAVEGLDRARE